MSAEGNPYPWLIEDGLWKPVTAILQAASASGVMFVSDGYYRIRSVRESHSVIGGSGATVQVEVLTSGQDADAGIDQLTAALGLETTADTPQVGVLIDPVTIINPGNMVGFVLAGTLTGLVNACVTVFLERLKRGV